MFSGKSGKNKDLTYEFDLFTILLFENLYSIALGKPLIEWIDPLSPAPLPRSAAPTFNIVEIPMYLGRICNNSENGKFLIKAQGIFLLK